MSNLDANSLKRVRFEDGVDSQRRKEIASAYTEYLSTKKYGFVLNVDGAWGTGKTHFLRSWKHYLETEMNGPAIYLDAWKSDFSKDPMLSLIFEIIECIKGVQKDSLGVTRSVLSSLMDKVVENSGKFFDQAYSYAGLAVDPVAIGAVKGISRIGGMLSERAASARFEYENYKDVITTLPRFKSDLKELITKAFGDRDLPLFVFVDELDRCRPSYSIEFLECIKHFFDIDNIVFVVVTNRSEMKGAVESVYGSGCDPEGYLSRFFNRYVTVPSPSIYDYLKSSSEYARLLDENMYIGRSTLLWFSAFMEQFGVSLRDADKIFDQIQLCESLVLNTKGSPLFLMFFCLVFKERFRGYYQRVCARDLALNAMVNELLDKGEIREKVTFPTIDGPWIDQSVASTVATRSMAEIEAIERTEEFRRDLRRMESQVNRGEASRRRMYRVIENILDSVEGEISLDSVLRTVRICARVS